MFSDCVGSSVEVHRTSGQTTWRTCLSPSRATQQILCIKPPLGQDLLHILGTERWPSPVGTTNPEQSPQGGKDWDRGHRRPQGPRCGHQKLMGIRNKVSLVTAKHMVGGRVHPLEGATLSQGNQTCKGPEVRAWYLQENTGHLGDQRRVDEGVTKREQGSDVEHSTEDALGPEGNGHYGRSLNKGKTWRNCIIFKK